MLIFFKTKTQTQKAIQNKLIIKRTMFNARAFLSRISKLTLTSKDPLIPIIRFDPKIQTDYKIPAHIQPFGMRVKTEDYYVGDLEFTPIGLAELQKTVEGKAVIELYEASKQVGKSHDFILSNDFLNGVVRVHHIITKADKILFLDLVTKKTVATDTKIIDEKYLLDGSSGVQRISTYIESSIPINVFNDKSMCMFKVDQSKTKFLQVYGLNTVIDRIPSINTFF